MGLSVGYPPSLEELYRQMSSSPAFAQMMMRQDQKEPGGASWLDARQRVHGLNIPPMPQMAAPPQQMPPMALQGAGPPQMPPQAPMPMGLPPMPQAQNQPSRGLLSGLIPEGGEFKERLGDMLMGFGGGKTWQDSLAQGGQAIAEGRRARAPLRAATEKENRTRAYAIQLGIPEDVAMGLDATNLMALIREKYTAQNKPADPMDAVKLEREQLELEGLKNPKPDKPDLVTLVSPDGKSRRSLNVATPQAASIVEGYIQRGWTPVDDATAGGSPTDDMREYEAAKAQGYTGTLMDFMRETKKPLVSIDNSTKLPTGYMWEDPADPAKGVKPLAGGPAEQIPGELAGRIGMADSFIGQLPEIREAVTAGKATGLWDSVTGSAGLGESGSVRRKIDSGADVLQRLMTGAGMPAAEAAEYARRYKPQIQDTAEVVLDKINQLERELKSAKEMAMRGRGTSTSAPEKSSGGVPEGTPQPGAVVDGFRFKGGDPSKEENWELVQ